uniref:Reticulon-1-A n=1 Tax=Sphaerodactylus townsendi TaxID=933632 RepID=A0ACB8G5L5_9SAUR
MFPNRNYLEMEMSLSPEQIQKYTNAPPVVSPTIQSKSSGGFSSLRTQDSLAFCSTTWLLTYVGALFNGLTLLIMAVVSMFSLPVVYDKYQCS